MIHVWQSNKHERLVEALAEIIKNDVDPFEKTLIIVPNHKIETYLKYEIASLNGICINIEFEAMSNLLKSISKTVYTDSYGHERSDLYTSTDILRILLDIFSTPEFFKNPEFNSLKSFFNDDRAPADVLALKRFQLAEELCTIFYQYTLSRPDWLQQWSEGGRVLDAGETSPEIWQQKLWELYFSVPYKDSFIKRVESRSELTTSREEPLPQKILVYGFSHITPEIFRVLHKLAERREIQLFTLNPCREYWEDVQRTPSVSYSFLSDHMGEEGIEDGWHIEDLPILRLWGTPGRNYIKFLNEITHFNFRDLFEAPASGNLTLLEQLQNDILVRYDLREPKRPLLDFTDDRSIHFFECPSVSREIEHIANTIWQLRREANDMGERLQFNDFMVLIPEQSFDKYQSLLRATFKQTHDIPCNSTDISAVKYRRVLEAVRLIIELPYSELESGEVLRILTHPNVLAKFPDIIPDLFERWIHDLHIVKGADINDLDHSFLKLDLYNWEQALRRLTLGVFFLNEKIEPIWRAPTPEDRKNRDKDSYVYEYLPHPVSADHIENAALFIELVTKLINHRRAARREHRTLREWLIHILELIEAMLDTVDDRPNDRFELQRVEAAFRSMIDKSTGNVKVAYRTAGELARKQIEGLEVSQGRFLIDGVTIAKLTPETTVPTKVVFVAGLSHDTYPRPDYRSSLNLRWQQPRMYDPPTGREMDEYLFLELILSTRRNLILSYVSVDPADGSEQQPSNVFTEFHSVLCKCYFDKTIVFDDPNPLLYTIIPKHRWTNPVLENEDVIDDEEEEIKDTLTLSLELAPWEEWQPEEEEEEEIVEEDIVDNNLAPSLQPQAILEYNAEALFNSFASQFKDIDLGKVTWEKLENRLSDDARVILVNTLNIRRFSDSSSQDILHSREVKSKTTALRRIELDHKDHSVSLYDIYEFLKSPLQGGAKFLYGMRTPYIEHLNETYLTSTPNSRDILSLTSEVFFSCCRENCFEQKRVLELLSEKSYRWELSGKSPTGLFRKSELKKFEKIIQTWRKSIIKGQFNIEESYFSCSINQPKLDYIESFSFPSISIPIIVDGEHIDINLKGITLPCNIHGQIIALKNYAIKPSRGGSQQMGFEIGVEALEPFLTILVLCIIEELWPDILPLANDGIFKIGVIGNGEFNENLSFKRPSYEEAREYLSIIISDLFEALTYKNRATRIPAETFLSEKNDKIDIETILKNIDALERFRSGDPRWNRNYSSLIGPVKNGGKYRIVDDPLEVYDKRFTLFFKMLARDTHA